MSIAITADRLLVLLEHWRVPLVQVDGWRERNREGHGAWGNMFGVGNHHTATPKTAKDAAVLRMLAIGRLATKTKPALPGPLYNLAVDHAGIAHLIGWGRANHAGSVRPEVLAALLADKVPTRPSTTTGETRDANAFLYGVAVINDGVGEPYTPDQVETLVRLNCALLSGHHWTAASAVQHAEITRRKTDMAPIMGRPAGPFLRAQISEALSLGPDRYRFPGSTWPIPLEDPMDRYYYGEGLDLAAAVTAAGAHPGSGAVFRAGDAREVVKRGGRLIVVGGPAIKALGLSVAVTAKAVQANGMVVVNGETAEDSARIALGTV